MSPEEKARALAAYSQKLDQLAGVRPEVVQRLVERDRQEQSQHGPRLLRQSQALPQGQSSPVNSAPRPNPLPGLDVSPASRLRPSSLANG